MSRVPWSWLAFGISAVQAGVCLMLSLVAILMIREGSGTDLALQTDRTAYVVAGVLQGAVIGMVVIAIARWVANRTRQPSRTFLIVAAALPVLLLLILAAWALATTGVRGLSLFDPRRWLEIPAFALTFCAAAWSYLAIARARFLRNSS